MARARYEYGQPPDQLSIAVAAEISQFLQAARVTLDVGLHALEMAEDEIRDRLAEESLSWSEAMTPWHSGHRGRSE